MNANTLVRLLVVFIFAAVIGIGIAKSEKNDAAPDSAPGVTVIPEPAPAIACRTTEARVRALAKSDGFTPIEMTGETLQIWDAAVKRLFGDQAAIEPTTVKLLIVEKAGEEVIFIFELDASGCVVSNGTGSQRGLGMIRAEVEKGKI